MTEDDGFTRSDSARLARAQEAAGFGVGLHDVRRTQADIDRSVAALESEAQLLRAWDNGVDMFTVLRPEQAKVMLEERWPHQAVPFVAALLQLAGPDASPERILELAAETDIAVWERTRARRRS